MTGPVQSGLDRLSGDARHLVKGRRVALLSHPASVDGRLRSARAVLEGAGAQLVALFGPEHGLEGEAQDMEGVDVTEGRAGAIPIYSLYGDSEASLRPGAEMLEGVELVVVDLQDIGSRYYTFVWTAALCLEACAEAGVELLVLDRPNPLTGAHVEGPGVESGYCSFVGLHDVATRHGMTLAEVLSLYARDKGLEEHLRVLEMKGYRRAMWFEETGLPWVLPSPNMPTSATALVYPGMCLLEGTDLSEGRGTTRPFELVGAPWVRGEALAAALDEEGLPGCAFRPIQFKPTFHKHAGQRCAGVQTHVLDREAFRPLRTGVALLRALFRLGADGERRPHFRTERYEFVEDRPAIDLLAGGTWLRDGLEAGASLDDLCHGWAASEATFEERRQAALLYR